MREQQPLRPPPRIEIPGLTPRRTWRDSLPRPRPWMLLFLPLLAFLAFLPAVALARFTTSNSQFCVSCHGVGDTPNRAVRSLVHPGFDQVGCVDCHAKPGQIVYEGYVHGFGAEPERVAPACERCHSEMRTRNDQAGFRHNFDSIRITHGQHLDRGATCVTCHLNVAHDVRTPPTNRPRMDYCYSCHARNDSCGKCHQGALPAGPAPFAASSAGDAQSDGRIIYLRQCSGCHGPGGDGIAQANLSSNQVLADEAAGRWREAVVNGRGSMPPLSKAQGGRLTDEQITAVLAYLKLAAQAAQAKPADPQDLYDRYCVTCHGADGSRIAAVPLNQASYWEGRNAEQVRAVIRMGAGGMPALGERYGGALRPADIEAVAVFARKLGVVKAAPATPGASAGPAAPALDGKALYASYCAGCHGADGSGLANANLGSKQYVQSRGADDLGQATKNGRGGMPALGKAAGGPLGDAEISAIVEYLLSR